MKTYIIVLTCVLFLTPLVSSANFDIRGDVKTDVSAQNNINVRGMELRHKLWKQEMDERKDEYQEKREAWKNAKEEDRSMLRADFRAAFVARFKWALDKLADFQTRLDARLEEEAEAGVDTSKAEVKLDESISFMATIKTNVEALKVLMDKEYPEGERETKRTEAKALFEKIKTDVKASHMALRAAFVELKAAKADMEAETSTEASVEVDD